MKQQLFYSSHDNFQSLNFAELLHIKNHCDQKIRKTKRHRDSSDTVTGHTKYVMEGLIQNWQVKIFNKIKLRLKETRWWLGTSPLIQVIHHPS